MADTLSKSMLKRHAVQMGVDITDTQREAFEKWAKTHERLQGIVFHPKYGYNYFEAQTAFDAWQAALAHSQQTDKD